jgi:ubiquinone/menaquinone biosynthesis C-methylase UbiE
MSGENLHVDFGAWAKDYAQHRKPHPKVLPALLAGARPGPGSRFLEVGCGTGNYTIAIQQATGCQCWGIDISEEMLAVAKERSTEVVFAPGRAENLGFADGFFDFIFMVDVIHHIKERAGYYREAFRVLKPGGRICTVTDNTEIIRKREPLSKYFPETQPIEFTRYPKDGELAGLMAQTGFSGIREEYVELVEEVTDISTWKSRSSSCLKLISDEAFASGVARMEQDLTKGPIRRVSPYILIWGTK